MSKTYNTRKRTHLVKTRLDDAEYEEFLRRIEVYGRIGNILNQIAHHLNEWHSPYPNMAKELQDASTDLAMLKYEILQKAGDALGNIHVHIVINSLRIAEVPFLPYAAGHEAPIRSAASKYHLWRSYVSLVVQMDTAAPSEVRLLSLVRPFVFPPHLDRMW